MGRRNKWLALGTIHGRHVMPCEGRYILPRAPIGQPAYDVAYDAALYYEFDPAQYDGIRLYFTGLTEVTMGVCDALAARGIPHVLMAYNHQTRRYTEVTRRIKNGGTHHKTDS